MYEDFFVKRLAALRDNKEVSAREMSLSLGQNRNYINDIENKKMFPTMQVFFYLCEYLDVTPQEFFAEDTENPVAIKALVEDLKKLDADALASVTSVVRELLKK